MFTGLVQGLGEVATVVDGEEGVHLRVSTPLASELAPGDSIAVNGVCLTATTAHGDVFEADVMRPTLLSSALGRLRTGARVNLELPLRAGDPLGGHVVQGHVDGTAEVVEVLEDGFARRVELEPPETLMRYLVEKGSVTIDGVSLTVTAVGDRTFRVSLIPETMERTTLGDLAPRSIVNVEVDVLAKYVERLLSAARG